jgi:hypothetical protein
VLPLAIGRDGLRRVGRLPYAFREPLWQALGNPYLTGGDAGHQVERHFALMALRIAAGIAVATLLLFMMLRRDPIRRAGWVCLLAAVAGAELIALAWPFSFRPAGGGWSRSSTPARR